MTALSAPALVFSELVLEVFRLNGRALAQGDVLAAPSGLTSARWQVLGVVDHGPAPASHVARTMGLTRQSVLELANALARDGFVRFTDNPHHRTAKLIEATPAGQRALRQIEARHAVWADRVGRRLGAARLRELVAGLREALQALEEDAVEGEARAAPRHRAAPTRRSQR